tara:strand:- start:611 stop:2059 length:1449 start_codon:yes stop_codon:yes gene_type:complete
MDHTVWQRCLVIEYAPPSPSKPHLHPGVVTKMHDVISCIWPDLVSLLDVTDNGDMVVDADSIKLCADFINTVCKYGDVGTGALRASGGWGIVLYYTLMVNRLAGSKAIDTDEILQFYTDQSQAHKKLAEDKTNAFHKFIIDVFNIDETTSQQRAQDAAKSIDHHNLRELSSGHQVTLHLKLKEPFYAIAHTAVDSVNAINGRGGTKYTLDSLTGDASLCNLAQTNKMQTNVMQGYKAEFLDHKKVFPPTVRSVTLQADDCFGQQLNGDMRCEFSMIPDELLHNVSCWLVRAKYVKELRTRNEQLNRHDWKTAQVQVRDNAYITFADAIKNEEWEFYRAIRNTPFFPYCGTNQKQPDDDNPYRAMRDVTFNNGTQTLDEEMYDYLSRIDEYYDYDVDDRKSPVYPFPGFEQEGSEEASDGGSDEEVGNITLKMQYREPVVESATQTPLPTLPAAGLSPYEEGDAILSDDEDMENVMFGAGVHI